MKIVVLGAGMVGKAMACDLSKQFDVTSVDVNESMLKDFSSEFRIKTIKADLSNSEIVKSIVENFDLVVGAVTGFMGYNTVLNLVFLMYLLQNNYHYNERK